MLTDLAGLGPKKPIDNSVFDAMAERLSKLTMKQLKQIAKDEQICLGYAASRKDTLVGAIVSQRRARCMELEADPATHPWRKWRSVKGGGVDVG